MDRFKRISDFIDSLPADSVVKETENFMEVSGSKIIGGSNGSNCSNALYDQCHKTTNSGDCMNYNSACPKATNHGSCMTTTRPEPMKPVNG